MSGLPGPWAEIAADIAEGSKVAGFARPLRTRQQLQLDAARVIYRAHHIHHSVALKIARALDREGLLGYVAPSGRTRVAGVGREV